MSALPYLATRAVVTDPTGEPTRIKLYDDAGALTAVLLDPATAISLAGDLIEAARIRAERLWA